MFEIGVTLPTTNDFPKVVLARRIRLGTVVKQYLFYLHLQYDPHDYRTEAMSAQPSQALQDYILG